MTLAVIRPSDWEFPLFFHVLGAILLMGSLLIAATALVAAWRRAGPDAVALTRFGLWTVIVAVLPSFLLMRLAGEWIADREGFGGDDDPDWIVVGYTTGDLGGLLVLISIVLAIIGLRTLRQGTADRSVLGRVVGVVMLLLLAAYAVAVWAMTTKPG